MFWWRRQEVHYSLLCELHFVVLQLRNKVNTDYFTLHSDDNLHQSRLNVLYRSKNAAHDAIYIKRYK